LLSEHVLPPSKYHDNYQAISWENSSVRSYLNTDFYGRFSVSDQAQILETQTSSCDNPWFYTDGGNTTHDKVFLLSIEEVVRYLGDSGQLKNPTSQFFIDDNFNDTRKAITADGMPSRWLLRTPGSSANFVAVVTIEGKISLTGDFVNRTSTELFQLGTRPAIWIKKESGTL